MRSILALLPPASKVDVFTVPIRAIGIDLGTTNSTAVEATWNPAKPDAFEIRCLEVEQPTLEGLYTNVLVPSVVAQYDGKQFVGEGAKRLRARSTELGLDQNRNLFYESKNEMGIRRTYHRAPEGFRSPPEIGSHVLSFLKAAVKTDGPAIARWVISVPASFQISQRQDTMLAATLAEIKISSGDLIDEPVAAFLDYLLGTNDSILPDTGAGKRLLVFDFGGGTCDVAILHLKRSPDLSIEIAPMAVSRYHRLGGGDIDRAIVHEVLLAQLRIQNNLSKHELTFEDKKRYIEPALLGIAEALKIGLCIEIAKLKQFDQYGTLKDQCVKTQPGKYVCRLMDRELQLQSPRLSAVEFETLLEPYLDRDLLFARESEYRLTCSVFAPLADALRSAGLEARDIDLCLMVGGSSLIPQVQEAVAGYFPKAKLLSYPDREAVQLSVARGAAIHALSLALSGRGIVTPVSHDSISIRTAAGPVELIPKGQRLPFPPGDGYGRFTSLAVPETNVKGKIPLRVEFVSGNDEHPVESSKWEIEGEVYRGESLLLEFRLDENQVFRTKLSMQGENVGAPFKLTIEHPLTHVVNPDLKRIQIDELEEDLRAGKHQSAEVPRIFSQLGGLHAELGQRERAVDFYRRALLALNRPDTNVLNHLARIYGELGDTEREEKCFKEAAAADITETAALFNLALAYRRRQMTEKSLETVEAAIRIEPDPPYLVLKGSLQRMLGRSSEAAETLEDAFKRFEDLHLLNDWELDWYLYGSRLAGKTNQVEKAEAISRARNKVPVVTAEDDGFLPLLRMKPKE